MLYEIPYELQHDKTNKMACAPSEDSDQPTILYRQYNVSHVTRKPVFGISDQVRLKLACLATETS